MLRERELRGVWTYLNISLGINKKILRLEVSVENGEMVKVLERHHHLSPVETSISFTVHIHTDRYTDRQTYRQTHTQT